jgi:hypothetical protein
MVKIRIRDKHPGSATLLNYCRTSDAKCIFDLRTVCTATVKVIISCLKFFPLVGTSIEGYNIGPPRLSSLLNAGPGFDPRTAGVRCNCTVSSLACPGSRLLCSATPHVSSSIKMTCIFNFSVPRRIVLCFK